MTIYSGVWGTGIWGVDKWGIKRAGIPVNLCLCPASLVAAFSQATPTHLSPSATITIDGVNMTAYLSDTEIHSIANGSASWCRFNMANRADLIAGIEESESIVSVNITYTLSDGTVFTVERFRGKVQDIEHPQELTGGYYTITAYDLGYKMTQSKPKAFAATSFTRATLSNPTMSSLINAELAYWGLSPFTGTFQDYSIRTLVPSQFSTAREFINGLANGRRLTTVFLTPSGQTILSDYSSIPSSGWTFYREGQYAQNFFFDSGSRYNEVPFSGNRNRVVKDLPDQALKGPMKHPGINTTLIANYTTNAEIDTLGNSIITDSYRELFECSTPLNPFVFPGSTVILERKDGTTSTVLVVEVDDIAGWPDGFWSTWRGKVIS